MFWNLLRHLSVTSQSWIVSYEVIRVATIKKKRTILSSKVYLTYFSLCLICTLKSVKISIYEICTEKSLINIRLTNFVLGVFTNRPMVHAKNT